MAVTRGSSRVACAQTWPILLDGHSPKFENHKLSAVKSFSCLPKNYGTWTIKFDRNGSQGHNGQEKYQRQGGHEDVNDALDETLRTTKGRPLDFDSQYSLAC